jgi:hypothetical protein
VANRLFVPAAALLTGHKFVVTVGKRPWDTAAHVVGFLHAFAVVELQLGQTNEYFKPLVCNLLTYFRFNYNSSK